MNVDKGVHLVQDERSALYNFATKEFDLRYMPETDEDAVCYIPQNLSAPLLFAAYRMSGKTVADALVEVLRLCVPSATKETP